MMANNAPYFMVQTISSDQAHELAMVTANSVADSLCGLHAEPEMIIGSIAKAYLDTYQSVIGWMPSTPEGAPELDPSYQNLVYPKSNAEFPFARQAEGKSLYCVTWRYREGSTRAVVVVAKNKSEANKLAEIGAFDSDVRYYYLGVSRPDVAEHVVLRSGTDE